MNTRTLATIGLLGAPFLLIDSMRNGLDPFQSNSVSGLLNLVYITAWMCSMAALKQVGAFGEGRFGKILFVVQMGFLALANCWNLYECIEPRAGTTLYTILDLFWPLSNLCMLVSGITIYAKKVLTGWQRYMPLLVGLWLPFAVVLWALFSRTQEVLLVGNLYSAIAWSLMAVAANTLAESSGETERAPQFSLQKPAFE
ncbi:MAG: hypothetical protein EOO14_14600 [Chitinophagaceae bacterium]|nr:MAG: hypothetical protein EOO14_14600 [Chitinophagaceae bacterium]